MTDSDGNSSAQTEQHSSDSLWRQIVVLLPDSFDLLSVGMVTGTLALASELSEAQNGGAYRRLQFLSEEGSHVRCGTSMTVATDKLSEVSEDHLRLVLVAAGPPRIDQNALMIGNWLKRISATGIPVLFLSSGGSDAARTRPSRMGSPTTALKFIRTDRADDIAREAAPDVTSLEAVEAMLVPLSDGGSPVSKVRGAARWMKDNCHRSISVADAVHECELSERTLLRYFRSYYGKSPSDYLRSVRVDYARKLLSDTHLSADKIARQVGLANGDRLCKLFRRYIGMSPSGYRSRHRAAVATESQHSGTRA